MTLGRGESECPIQGLWTEQERKTIKEKKEQIDPGLDQPPKVNGLV